MFDTCVSTAQLSEQVVDDTIGMFTSFPHQRKLKRPQTEIGLYTQNAQRIPPRIIRRPAVTIR